MTAFLNILIVGLMLGGIYGLVSMGLNLIFGVVRIVNFAQGELVMLGMYGAYLSWYFLGLDPYLSALIVVPGLFVIGVVIQRFVLQPLQNEPFMQIFATFGLLMLFQNIVLAITGGTGYSVRSEVSATVLSLGEINVSLARLVVLVTVVVVALGLNWFVKYTMPGKAVRAVIRDGFAAASALEAVSQPEDIAEAAVFLALDARRVTGQFLTVDAGFTLGRAVRLSR